MKKFRTNYRTYKKRLTETNRVSYEPNERLRNIHCYVFLGLVIFCRKLTPSFDPFLFGISIISPAAYHNQIAGMREFLPEIRPVLDGPEIGERHILRYRFEENGWWRDVLALRHIKESCQYESTL